MSSKAIAVLIVTVTLATRLRTFGNPVLGFDEQFYLLVGDRMLHGALPYVDIWDRKPIGLFVIYAAIRLLGGEGTIQYQLVAAAFVAATAFLIERSARRAAPPPAALMAAIAYIAWLALTEGEGGQAPVFYNLPVLVAALFALRTRDRSPRTAMAIGSAAMLACGIAIQIKYTVMFEGALFGVAMLWWQANHGTSRRWLAGMMIGWIAAALIPTAAALLAYHWLGARDAFVFANFRSIFGKSYGSPADKLAGIAVLVGIAAPLLIAAGLGLRRSPPQFVHLWLVVALGALLPFATVPNPSSLMPVLVPAAIAAAPGFAAHRRAAIILLAVILVTGQVVLASSERWKGGRAAALAIAAAARPRAGCLYVYDGYPALYRLTGSCLPSRFVFPGHLDTASEAASGAIGVDPTAEVARILACHPDTIVDTLPVFVRGNPATHRLVMRAVARDYRLVRRVVTGTRARLVFRRRLPGGGVQSCPD